MICSLLIMMIVFINGIENTKQKVKHFDTVLREEELDTKAKAWLLMVESGKVDEEEVRRITPKSIFIAPLLTNRAAQCPEGYRYDHLGQCVKVIKADPKIQLELLLKKLSSLYATDSAEEEKEEEEDKALSKPSSGPLQFSIPILNEEEKEIKPLSEEIKSNSSRPVNISETTVPNRLWEFMPIPLPIIMLNRTKEPEKTEIESSGAGPFNETEPFITPETEDVYFSSGDSIPDDKEVEDNEQTTTPFSLFLEDTD